MIEQPKPFASRRAVRRDEEILKIVLDVVSLVSIAVFFGLAVWLAIWGEEPSAPGHFSLQLKMVLLDGFPFMFGCMWLLFRYATAAVERFPRMFGPRGLLFYLVLIFGGIFVLRVCAEVWSNLTAG